MKRKRKRKHLETTRSLKAARMSGGVSVISLSIGDLKTLLKKKSKDSYLWDRKGRKSGGRRSVGVLVFLRE